MNKKVQEKLKAMELRKKGFSYNDILKEVSVSKSSLSAWLKDLPLTEDEKIALKHRTNSNISKGRIRAASALRDRRIFRERNTLIEAKKDFERYKNDPLFFTGISLYWAEGSKRNNSFQFMNSDPKMIKIVLSWYKKFCNKGFQDVELRLFTHKPYASDNLEVFWSKETGIPLTRFKKTIYKPTNLGIKKRPNYKGCLRIEVRKSTSLFRKIQFWQNAMISYFG